MNLETAIDILTNFMQTALVLVLPILGAAMGIGLTVSLVQSVTSIQEQTMTFVPKLLGVVGILVASASWLLTTLTDYCTTMFQLLPEMAP